MALDLVDRVPIQIIYRYGTRKVYVRGNPYVTWLQSVAGYGSVNGGGYGDGLEYLDEHMDEDDREQHGFGEG